MISLRELLDKASQRLIMILDILMTEENWVTIKSLSSTVGCSERTIATDIGNLRKRWGQQLDIHVSTKNGIKLNNRNVSAISKVFIDVFDESTILKFLETIIFYPGNTIEFYEERVFVSRSTLIRLLPKINRFFSGRGMAVRNTGNGYELVSENEQYLREFCTDFLLELYGFDLAKHHIHIDLMRIMGIVFRILDHNLEACEKHYVKHDGIAIGYYPIFYLLSLVREDQGYTIASDYDVDQELYPDDLSYLTSYFPHITKANLCPLHEYIANRYNGWDSDEEKELVTKEISNFFERLGNSVSPSFDDDTFRDLCFMMRAMYFAAKARPFKTSTLFNRLHYFSVLVKRNNGFFYDLVERNLAIFSQRTDFDISPQAEAILLWMCLDYPEFATFIPKRRILVVSDFGFQHANFIARFIMSRFNKENTLIIDATPVNLTDAQASLAAEDYDIVVTTTPQFDVEQKRTILINDYPEHRDLCRISEALYF